MSEMDSVSENAVPKQFTPALATDPEFSGRNFDSINDAWAGIVASGRTAEVTSVNNRYPILCVGGKYRIAEPTMPSDAEWLEKEGDFDLPTEVFSFSPAIDVNGKNCYALCDDHGNPMGPVTLVDNQNGPKPFVIGETGVAASALNVDLAATNILDRFSKLRDLLSQVGISDIPKLLSILQSVDVSKFPALMAAYESLAGISTPIDTQAGISDRTKAALALLLVWSSMTATTTDDALVGKLGVIVGNEMLLNTVSAIVAAVIQKMEANKATAELTPFDSYTDRGIAAICNSYTAEHQQGQTVHTYDAGDEEGRVSAIAAASFDFQSISTIVQAIVGLIGLIRGLRKPAPPATAAIEQSTVNEFGNTDAGNFGGHKSE